MLPALNPESALEKVYVEYLDALSVSGFRGEIETQYSSRLAVATDNSIYQQLPQAVVFPRHVDDLMLIGQLAKQHIQVQFSARGGGTGTNGQSLTSGLVVDVSRHMNQILEINPDESWVKVQAGVVKDQLNDALKPYGFFFAPDLSTSNRATIGGMINTDASGQGSLVYGKTSDHVLALTAILADGTKISTHRQPIAEIEQQANSGDSAGKIAAQLLDSCVGKRDLILSKFPRLNRFLTGYDLEHTLDESLDSFDVGRVITGSEGSLAFVAEAKLNITPIAKHKALLNIKYDSFESALRHAPHMVAAQATSVETVDSKVLNLARQDIIWHSVENLIQDVPDKQVLGLNMVEYNSNDQGEIETKINELCTNLHRATEKGEHGLIGFQLTYDTAEIGKIYAMRKKAVGLLGKAKGWQKPIAFAEDTAVPPENLADFIMEFRALLDAKGLQYGMFGHVDAGVLHVRPALDLCDPQQEALMLDISDQVVALVAKYGGLMWGEHGKGYRSEYGPAFFGDTLFNELRKIKTAFDPHNQMNPGKICTPLDSNARLVKVSDQKRADFDRQIPVTVRDSFEPAMSCNGNGLCYNYDTTSPMCPSSKITRDRRHSPKGRAGMIREWLRLLNRENVDLEQLESGEQSYTWFERLRYSTDKFQKNDFSHEVLEVMEGCLACKACANQCPVNVDVPGFRARFLSIYYQRYLRPLKDHLVVNIETMAPVMAKAPRLINFLQDLALSKWLVKKVVGYVDAPLLSFPTLVQHQYGLSLEEFNLSKLSQLDDSEKRRKVLLVQDPFTSFYEAQLVADFASCIQKLGFDPIILPFKPNGKPQHVKGFLTRFANTARSSAEFLNKVAELKIPMLGVDASLVLCYRDEYSKILGQERGDFSVLLAHEWLSKISLSQSDLSENKKNRKDFVLFSHCTEKTALPTSEREWQEIFSRLGLKLTSVPLGCCGMAGTFGHESSHIEESTGIYNLSWQSAITSYETEQILVTGYSCRSQVARLDGFKPRHPVQLLNELLQQS